MEASGSEIFVLERSCLASASSLPSHLAHENEWRENNPILHLSQQRGLLRSRSCRNGNPRSGGSYAAGAGRQGEAVGARAPAENGVDKAPTSARGRDALSVCPPRAHSRRGRCPHHGSLCSRLPRFTWPTRGGFIPFACLVCYFYYSSDDAALTGIPRKKKVAYNNKAT